MKGHLIGAHMPTSGGLGKAIGNGKSIGCNTVQLFTSNPRQWKGKVITPELVQEVKSQQEKTEIKPLISHDTYLINLCAPKEEIQAKSTEALKEELLRCGQLGISYVISHMGAHLGQGETFGLDKIAQVVTQILKETPLEVTLCMETTAGQGSALNYKFEHLAYILEKCHTPSNLAVCLDTCHIFAAGYDISTEEGYHQTFNRFDQIIGLDKIKVIHCNDSKKECGAKVDRHEHIGKGYIGTIAFQLLVNDTRFFKIPIILETPDPEQMHEVNIKQLLSYIK